MFSNIFWRVESVDFSEDKILRMNRIFGLFSSKTNARRKLVTTIVAAMEVMSMSKIAIRIAVPSGTWSLK